MKILIVPILFLGNFFTPHPNSEEIKNKKHALEVSVSSCKLRLYELRENGSRVFVREYTVATAKRGLKPVPFGKGTVTRIKFNPWWYPTAYSREYFAQKGILLPEAVPPGDPLNFLGVVNIHLSHTTSKGTIYRIHGNNDETSIGKRVTGGCVRMHNKDAEELAKMIMVGTEVNIIP